MKEFRLEPVNKQIQEMLEEMQVYLQEFEELKDCYINGTTIKVCKNNKLTTIVNITKYMTDRLKFSFWDGEPIQNLMFEDVFDYNGLCEFIKIKEPQPHQARKKTLEELEIGDFYYVFNSSVLLMDDKINNRTYWNKFKLGYEDEVQSLKNLLKHSRIFVALDEEEIKAKVLD